MAGLTLAEAETILAAAKAKVLAFGANMSISVVDPRGDLLTMMRTDGASWRTPAISRAKAVAASCFGRVPAFLLRPSGTAGAFFYEADEQNPGRLRISPESRKRPGFLVLLLPRPCLSSTVPTPR